MLEVPPTHFKADLGSPPDVSSGSKDFVRLKIGTEIHHNFLELLQGPWFEPPDLLLRVSVSAYPAGVD